MCRFESVNSDGYSLAFHVDLEGLWAGIRDFERAFIWLLERSVVSIAMNKNKLGLQQIARNRSQCGAMMRYRNWGK